MEASDEDWMDDRDLEDELMDDREDWGVKFGVGGVWPRVVGIVFADAPRAVRRTRTSSSSSATRPSR